VSAVVVCFPRMLVTVASWACDACIPVAVIVMCDVRCVVCGVRCAMCDVRCAMCDVRCAMCGVQ
jgi:hypothetical protein